MNEEHKKQIREHAENGDWYGFVEYLRYKRGRGAEPTREERELFSEWYEATNSDEDE